MSHRDGEPTGDETTGGARDAEDVPACGSPTAELGTTTTGAAGAGTSCVAPTATVVAAVDGAVRPDRPPESDDRRWPDGMAAEGSEAEPEREPPLGNVGGNPEGPVAGAELRAALDPADVVGAAGCRAPGMAPAAVVAAE